jgi:hypothetical protein
VNEQTNAPMRSVSFSASMAYPGLRAPMQGFLHKIADYRGSSIALVLKTRVTAKRPFVSSSNTLHRLGTKNRQGFHLAPMDARSADLVKINLFVISLNRDKLTACAKHRILSLIKIIPPITLAGVATLFRDDVQIEIEAEAAIP